MRLEDLNKKFKTISGYEKIFLKKNKEGKKDFQRLEFLGDKVLGLVISSIIYNKYKNFSEGSLSRAVAYLCSGKVLSDIGVSLKLDVLLNKKKRNISEKVLADNMEVIIGAYYIKNGFVKTKKIIYEIWKEEIINIIMVNLDNKTALQEWSQSMRLGLPEYSLINKTGPDHQPAFTVKVKVLDHRIEKAKGKTLQDAEQNAAKKFLDKLKINYDKKIN